MKARRHRQWALNAKLAEGESKGKIEGKIEGEIKLIRTWEILWGRVPTDESQLKTQELDELQRIANELQTQLRSPHRLVLLVTLDFQTMGGVV